MRRVILFAILFLALAALLSTADAAEVGRGGSKQIRAAIEATEQRKRLAVRRARRRLLRPFRKKWRARMNKVRRARRSARKELKVGLDLELKKVKQSYNDDLAKLRRDLALSRSREEAAPRLPARPDPVSRP